MNAMHPDHEEDRMNEGPWGHHLPAFYKGGPWGVERTHVTSPLESDRPMDMLTFDGTTSNPVGRRTANPWGLYDMHGSLFEWVLDGYGPYDPAQTTNPLAAAPDAEKVIRGGSYMSHKPAEDKDKLTDANKFRSIRSASRNHLPSDFELPVTGMRIVLGPKRGSRKQ